jgi:hypothetical protein
MLTREAIAFSELGCLWKSTNPVIFAEDQTVNDPSILREVQALLTQKVGRLKKVFQLSFSGSEDEFFIQGKAEQEIGVARSQYYTFLVSPNNLTYKLTNAKAASDFAATAEFALGRKKSSLRCNPGNIQCGGKCQHGTMNCNQSHSPEQKKGWAAIAQKIVNLVGKIKGKFPSRKPQEKGETFHKDLINNGAKAIPKGLTKQIDDLRSLTDRADNLKSQIKKMVKGPERDKLIEQHKSLKVSVTTAEAEAIASMSNYRKSLLNEASAENKKLAKKFVQGLFVEGLDDKNLRREVLGHAREFGVLTGGKGGSSLRYIVQTTDRAYADRKLKEVNLGEAPQKSINFHEMAHHIEYENPKLGAAALTWVKERATSKKTQSLNKLSKSSDYDKDEVAYPDKFIDPYVGKVYKEKGKELPYTEVISMGIERFSSPESMVKFYAKDPEHFHFTMGVLKHRGS